MRVPERVVVTGANGFVGSAVVRALIAQGRRVCAFVRPGADLQNLEGLDLEIARGDLCDRSALVAVLEGAVGLYHVGARYSLWSQDAAEMYRTNVHGTQTVLQAALDARVQKVVHTSSVGTLGIPADGPGCETTPVGLAEMVGPYKRSKFQAEEVARQFAGKGLAVVIVNPSTPVGPRDIKPTPTGQVIVDLLRGRMPGYVETGLNYVDVEDVAQGHLLAFDKGEIGQRYILGHENIALGEFLALVAEAAGRKPPRWKFPLGVALAAGLVSEATSLVTRQPPHAPLAGVLMARKRMYFESDRAVRELGMPQNPVRAAVERAVRWFVDHGYAA